jgi:DNA polymerase
MPTLFRDYETRSTLDLRDVGVHRYVTHPSTNVWCCAYAVDDGPVKLWVPGDPVPGEFAEAAHDPEWRVSAFNDNFERQVECCIMAPRYSWPLIPIERHECTQAMALALALPAKLENVAKELRLKHQKDADGARLMLQMARPRKLRRDEDPNTIRWFDDAGRRERLGEYCRQDIETERELRHRVSSMVSIEHPLWVLDAEINDFGFHVDHELLDAAISIAEAANRAIVAELQAITSGAITSISQTQRLITWLAAHGCMVTDVQKSTLKQALRRKGLLPDARRVIELRLDGAHAAASKLYTLRDWRGDDNRVRGWARFHGASTGRWTSLGVQAQNMKRLNGLDVDAAMAAVRSRDYVRVRQTYPQPLSVVGNLSRAMICAPPGHRLIAADFSGIESRVTAWISGQQDKLDQWREFDRTKDLKIEPYYLTGKQLGVPEEQARIFGKTADLAFGYMGGIPAWRKMAAFYLPDDASTDEEIKQRQRAWRAAHPRVACFWAALNRAAVWATHEPSKSYAAGRITFEHNSQFLFLTLPSGRKLSYPFAELMTAKYENLAVTFKDNQGGKFVPVRYGHGAYGAIWIENVVQAIARDLFAATMLRLNTAGYRICLHVHDEICVEVPENFGSTEEFERLMGELPAWAVGLPVACKVRVGKRFCKTNGG